MYSYSKADSSQSRCAFVFRCQSISRTWTLMRASIDPHIQFFGFFQAFFELSPERRLYLRHRGQCFCRPSSKGSSIVIAHPKFHKCTSRTSSRTEEDCSKGEECSKHCVAVLLGDIVFVIAHRPTAEAIDTDPEMLVSRPCPTLAVVICCFSCYKQTDACC